MTAAELVAAPATEAAPSDEAQRALASALAKAQGAAQAVGKDATNEHHRYAYASAEAIIDEARSALSSHGLAVSQLSSALRQVGQHLVLRTEYLLQHEAGGRLRWGRDWFVIEGKGRPFDRASAAALTSSLAYALRDLLLLPRDDQAAGEAAMDRRDDRDHEPHRQAAGPRGEPEQERRPAGPPREGRPQQREEPRARDPERGERRPPQRDDDRGRNERNERRRDDR